MRKYVCAKVKNWKNFKALNMLLVSPDPEGYDVLYNLTNVI